MNEKTTVFKLVINLMKNLTPQFQFFLAMFLMVIGGATAALCAFWMQTAWSSWEKQSEPSKGQLSGKILDEQKPYILTIGGMTTPITGENLKKGINLLDFLSSGKQYKFPVKIYEENNRLMVDAEIYDDKEDLLCSIVRNEWTYNPNNRYDRNHNLNAFEIIDAEQIPVLQIYLEEPNKIYLGGYVRTPRNKHHYFTLEVTLLSADKPDESIKRLFKYPSSEHLNKMENVTLNSFKEYDEDAALEEAITNNKTAYSQLNNNELKLKTLRLIDELKKLRQSVQRPSTEAMRYRGMSPEEYEKKTKALQEAKLPTEKEKVLSALMKNQEQFLENLEQKELPAVESYNKKIRLDAILTRDELLRRLKEIPQRGQSVSMLDLSYRRPRNTFDLTKIANDLEVLVKNLE